MSGDRNDASKVENLQLLLQIPPGEQRNVKSINKDLCKFSFKQTYLLICKSCST